MIFVSRSAVFPIHLTSKSCERRRAESGDVAGRPIAARTVYAADGLGFLAETPGSVDTVSWLWSMNYALLQHYERYDSESGSVQLRDWTAADQLGRERLRAAIDAHRKADVFPIMFDSDSPEQVLITGIWSRVAPFPFHDRSHTRRPRRRADLRPVAAAPSAILINVRSIGSGPSSSQVFCSCEGSS